MSRLGAFESAFLKADNTLLMNQGCLMFGLSKDPEDPDCASPEDMAESLASLRLAALAMDALAPHLAVARFGDVADAGDDGRWLIAGGRMVARLGPEEADAVEAALAEARKGG